MGMRSLSPASCSVWPQSLRRARRKRRAIAVDRAVSTVIESLEKRVLFAVSIAGTATTPATVTARAATETVVVDYVDSDIGAQIQNGGFGAGNLTVSVPAAAAPVTVAFVSDIFSSGGITTPETVVATYTVAPTGGFTPADNGTYTVNLNAGVMDNAMPPNTTAPAMDLTTFMVAIPPTATITPPATITAAGATTAKVVVTYTDTNGKDVLGSTVGNGVLTANGPSGAGSMSLAVTMGTVTPSPLTTTASPTYVVTYTVDAPTGGFSAADNGTYTIGLSGNVTDNGTPAVPIAATTAMFTVDVADVPTAVLTQPATITTAGGNSEAIVVTYSDPITQIEGSTIVVSNVAGDNNISVVPPTATPVTITAVTPSAPANGSPIVATYTASLPAGQTWNSALDGTYTIELNGTALAGAVTNINGTPVTADPTFGTFSVDISDTIHPTASVSAPPLLQSIGNTHQIVVDYVDNAGVLTSSVTSVGTGAITVTDNTTGETLDVIGESIAAGTATNPKVLPVTYTLEQPDGNEFTAADNGSYTIALVGSPPITDTSGNAVLPNANLGTFDIEIGDTGRPTATVTANEVTSNGATGETITFVLTDDQDINVSTINLKSVSVLSSSGVALTPKSLSLSTAVNAQTITAIYVVSPPNGQAFRGVDNGTYNVSLNGVQDVAGLAMLPSSASSTFQVNVQEPQTPIYEGQFGIFNGKQHKLHFYDVPAGASVTITGRGGQGNVYQEGDGSLNMNITDFGGGLNVNVQTSGNRPITYRDVVVTGSVNNFQSLTGNLDGVFQVSGTLTKATFRQLLGTVVASGPILNLRVLRAVTDSQVLSGVLFGTDGIFGANPTTGIDDDTYAPGFIDNVFVGGAIADSVFAAGADPGPDNIFGFNQVTQDDDDVRAGTYTSTIRHVTALGADALTRFEAGHYGTFKIDKVTFFPNPATDSRFKGL
jgi:hypothetical protein